MLVPMLLFCFDVPTSAALFAGVWNVVKPMLGSISPVTLHPLCDSAHRREHCIILSGGSTDKRQTVALETSVGLPETSVGYWKLPRADKRTVAKISIHSKRKTWEKELHERARPVRLLAAYSRMPVWPTHGL